jgi:hypothetical protein
MNDTTRTTVGYGVPAAWAVLLVASYGTLPAVWRFLGATVGLFLAVKVGAWLLVGARDTDHHLSPVRTLLFWTAWPGVRPDQFDGSEGHADPDARTFLEGYAFVWVGVALALAALLSVPHVGVLASTWLLLFAVLAVVHSGVGRLLPFALRWAGLRVPDLFEDPLRSESVGAFWSQRWNRPFVGMNRLFLTRPLAGRLGMGGAADVAFLVSGLLHELAISYAAGAGFGGPMLYFVVQAAGYTAEQRALPEQWGRPALRRLWTYLVVFGPLPVLFHAPFRATFLAPLVEGGRALLFAHPLVTYVDAALWLAAGGHFLVLAASYRVPEELEWDEDLASLTSLNRKLMWTYGGFIVLTIVAFGVMSAAFHAQLVAGTPVALGLCAFVATFWTARILVDTLYFSHDDWPEGVEYVVGHALLTSLFAFLVVVYGGTVAYHVV